MRPSALIGASIGAVLGALLWAGVAALTGLEIGWIAWGVGGAVGFGAALLGGRGPATGFACAVLALAAILAGKWLAVDMVAEAEIRKLASQFAPIEMYQGVQADAVAFREVHPTDHWYKEYMVDNGYTEELCGDDVHEMELVAFKADVIPQLEEFNAKNPSYAEWRGMVADEMVQEWERSGSNLEVVKEGLSPMDLLFGLLGVVTAFQVGARGIRRPGPQKVHFPQTAGSAAPSATPDAAVPAPEPGFLAQEAPPNPYAQTDGPRSDFGAAQPAAPEPAPAPAPAPIQRRTIPISRVKSPATADPE